MTAATAGRRNDALDQRLRALMAQAQDGDRSAYASLLEACQPVIRRVARKVGLVDDRIEDAVQETLLTIHQARHAYDPSRSFIAWLTVLAQRRAIDTLRRAGRVDRREIHAPILYAQHADTETDPSRRLDEGLRSRELRTAISTLTTSQREAVEHLALREQSLAEAAVETGKTTGALKVNLHRALKALRLKMVDGEKRDG